MLAKPIIFVSVLKHCVRPAVTKTRAWKGLVFSCLYPLSSRTRVCVIAEELKWIFPLLSVPVWRTERECDAGTDTTVCVCLWQTHTELVSCHLQHFKLSEARSVAKTTSGRGNQTRARDHEERPTDVHLHTRYRPTANQCIIMISEDHVTLKTGEMMLEIHRHKLQFNIYNITVFFIKEMQLWWAEETQKQTLTASV